MTATSNGILKLDLVQLGKLDGGRLNLCLAQHLRKVAMDLDDRPGDKRPRTISINLTFDPDMAVDGLLDGADMKAQVTSKLPSHKSKAMKFGVRDGSFTFSTMSTEDHRVQALPGIIDDEDDSNYEDDDNE